MSLFTSGLRTILLLASCSMRQAASPAAPVPASLALKETSSPSTASASKGTSCLPCSRHHTTTVSGALSEAVRFARSGGLQHPEVMRRLAISEEELDIMERVDLTPANIVNLSARENKIAHWVLNESRNLRHQLDELKNSEDLEKAAAQAQNMNIEYRARLANLSPEDTAMLKAAVHDVSTGRLTKEDAIKKLTLNLKPLPLPKSPSDAVR